MRQSAVSLRRMTGRYWRSFPGRLGEHIALTGNYVWANADQPCRVLSIGPREWATSHVMSVLA